METLCRGQRVGGYSLNFRNDVVQYHYYMCKGNSPETMSLDDCLEKLQLFVGCLPHPSCHPIFLQFPVPYLPFILFLSYVIHDWTRMVFAHYWTWSLAKQKTYSGIVNSYYAIVAQKRRKVECRNYF